MPHLPGSFDRVMQEVDLQVAALFVHVVDGLPRATSAFLHADDGVTAGTLAELSSFSDSILGRVEAALDVDIALRNPVGSDLRHLLTVLRVVPELERSGDLISHIADRAGLGARLPAAARHSFTLMSDVAVDMWSQAAVAWERLEPDAAQALDEIDDVLDEAVETLPDRLRGTPGLLPVEAMEAVLVGRFYERLGDHAVHLCQRIRWLVTGR